MWISSAIRAAYTAGRAAPPDDPRLMVRILLYGYTTGVCSSRVIERKCVDDRALSVVGCMGSAPDYRAIARFRKRHLSALGNLFVEALALCQAAGMVRLGRVALDGTRVRDNASTRKVMRYTRRVRRKGFSPRRSGPCWPRPNRSMRPRMRRWARAVAVTSRQSSCGDAKLGWPRSARAMAPWRPRLGSRSGSGPLRNRTAQRALVGAFLLALTFAGGYAVAAHKTVTLSSTAHR